MKHKESEPVILLTATITPNSLVDLTIKDPEIRRQQYIKALNFYIAKTNYRIVFTENSGASLDMFPLLPERLEYLIFQSGPNQPDRGIGYKEMEIIDFAFKNSKFLQETKAVVKITGRLKILNLKKLSKEFLKLRQGRSHLVYACTYKPGNMDSRCFFFTKDFWPYLKKTGDQINLKYNFESALWQAISQYGNDNSKNYFPFNTPLRIKGWSGSFGVKYKHQLVFHYARISRDFFKKMFGKNSTSN